MAWCSDSTLNSRVATTIIYPGTVILKEGGYLYTAGPRASSRKFYTAGHAAYDVFSPYFTLPNQTLIGSQSNIVFGTNGDCLQVDTAGYTCSPPSTNCFVAGTGTYTYAASGAIMMGDAVEMHGAVSGISSGNITAYDVEVFVSSHNVTVQNVCAANYVCRNGDSGAGVFTPNAFYTSSSCYGIQSAGVFVSGASYATISYFAMF